MIKKSIKKLYEEFTLLKVVLYSDMSTKKNDKARATIKKIIRLMKEIEKELD